MAALLFILPLLTPLTFLHQVAVTPKVGEYYDDHVMEFMRWLQRSHSAPIANVQDLDVKLESYFTEMYDEDAAPSFGEKTLAGLAHRLPRVPGSLSSMFPSASRCLKGWRRMMPPRTRPPLPFDAMLTCALSLSCHVNVAMGMAVLLGFFCYLRPRELTGLMTHQLIPPADREEGSAPAGQSIFMNWSLLLRTLDELVASKTGHYDENIVIDSKWLVSWINPFLEALLEGRRSSHMLWNFTHEELSAAFKREMKILRMEKLITTLYGLRHGGASFDTLFSLREPKAIKLRGRWSSDRSLLRYRKASLAQNEANKVPLGVRQLSRIIAANPAKHFDDLTQSRQQLSGLRASRTR